MLFPAECRFSSVTPGKLPPPIPGWHIVVEMDPRTDPPNRSSEQRQLLDSAQSKLFRVFINDPNHKTFSCCGYIDEVYGRQGNHF